MTCGAVIPAAGHGRRFGEGDKTTLAIARRPVLEWTLDSLIRSQRLSQIVVVVSDMNHAPVLDVITRINAPIPISTVPGGDLRMESVQAGVRALDPGCDLVLIHDAARPVLDPALVETAVEAGVLFGAAIPGIPVTDTIKRVDERTVVETVDRGDLVAVQTPQVFRRDWLETAYRALNRDVEATDEAAIIESAGFPVHVFSGDPANIKVTTAADAIIAEALLSRSGARQ